jgi:5-methylcytosine-specific restriction endonuclease McrA
MFRYFQKGIKIPQDGRRLIILKEGYGKNWPKQRKLALIRDNFQCQKCGFKGTLRQRGKRKYWDVSVHHKRKIKYFVGESGHCDYEKANDLSNLTTLCENCHPYQDSHRDYQGFSMLR